MSEPMRIQRKRAKGWRMPEGAVYVGRPTKWGNPFAVVAVKPSGPFDVMCSGEFCGQHTGIESARRSAVDRFRRLTSGFAGRYPHLDVIRRELAGRDLACWCPLEDERGNPVPCHADVLLEIANRTEEDR